MNKIKFSHLYKKLNGVNNNEAILLDVVRVQLEKLSQVFKDYDTDNGIYELPKKGEYMLLIFDKGCIHEKHIFITIRRWTPPKEIYYKGKIGQLFQVEINNKESKNHAKE